MWPLLFENFIWKKYLCIGIMLFYVCALMHHDYYGEAFLSQWKDALELLLFYNDP